MKLVYTAPNSLMVDHLKLVLDSAGIDAVVEHRHLSSASGMVPAQETWPELWVLDDAEEPRARALIAWAAGDERQQHPCLACGELLAEPFSTCWRCGADYGSVLRPTAFRSQEEASQQPPWPPSWRVINWLAIVAAATVALAMLHAYSRTY
jgi:hypothetical protein